MESTKPKVATNTRLTCSEKKEKILRILNGYPEGITPKEIASICKINHNTTKTLLIKLKNNGKAKIVDSIKGSYASVENNTHGLIFDWNFHNTCLITSIPCYTGERVEQIINCGPIKLFFEIGAQSKQATLHISTDKPIPMNSLLVCYALFKEIIKNTTGLAISEKEVYVNSIEFNKDYANSKLEGVNCLTFDSLLSQFKIYQKEEGVRVEHKLKGELSWEAVSILLSGQSNYLNLCEELVQLKKSVERDLKKLNQGFTLMIHILDRLDKGGAF